LFAAHQDSALYPFIVQLERAAGFARDDSIVERLGKLRGLLAPGARGDDEIELLAELLSLPSNAAEMNLSPQRKREALFEALLHQLEALVRSCAVLMIFEDTHWIDPTTRELLDLTLDQVKRLPVLLVVTFRPEFQQGWSGQAHVTTLALNRLGGNDGAALVERLAGNAGLARETVNEIVERADGVPLFVEELTKAVLESGDHDNRVAAVLTASPLPELAIPATARLTDRASRSNRADREGGWANRCSTRPRIRLRSDRTGGAAVHWRVEIGARPARCGGAVVLPRCCAGILLPRWRRTPPMALCCARDGRSCTPVSRRRWRSVSLISSSANPSSSPII
jgi:hypothetical protein